MGEQLELFPIEPSPCLEPSTGWRDRQGYVFCGTGRRGRHARAHRFAYEQAYGKVPKGILICHRCDNPSCIKLSHLFAGTVADNNQDTARKGRTWRQKMRGKLAYVVEST